MATKPGRVVTYNEELPPIKSHDLLIMWSSGFDFSCAICRFRTQTPKSSLSSCYICFKSKTLCICWFSPSSSTQIFWNIGKFRAEKYITDH